jgi:hypothetical protein
MLVGLSSRLHSLTVLLCMYSMGKKLKGYVMGLYMAGRGGGREGGRDVPSPTLKSQIGNLFIGKLRDYQLLPGQNRLEGKVFLVGGEVASEILSVDKKVTHQWFDAKKK